MNVGRHDPSRGARVVARAPLLYERGPDAALDRPAHMRAGSALVALPDARLAVIQDDACFLAVIDPGRAFVITDRDDPAAPSELLTIRLGDAWTR